MMAYFNGNITFDPPAAAIPLRRSADFMHRRAELKACPLSCLAVYLKKQTFAITHLYYWL